MIEIIGTGKEYIVRKEDIKSIEHYDAGLGYVKVEGIGDIEIENEEYQKLKKLLEILDKESE